MENNMKIYEKSWGYEKWIVNNEMFCGKILHINKNASGSYHYHKIKNEVFYVQSGKIKLRYSSDDDITLADEIVLNCGEKFEIPVNLRHQIIGLEESDIFEISTQHFESDSYRICVN